MNAPLAVGLVIRDQHPQGDEVRDRLVAFLSSRDDAELIDVREVDQAGDWPRRPDIVAVVGGDGSMLRACRSMGRHQLPMIGINLGRLGFLTDLTPESFLQQFSQLVARRYRIIHHLMFVCRLERPDEPPQEFLGLNEVAIHTGASLRMLDIELSIDDEQVATYSCDGLIVSTPIGSTAHSLAAGGPLLRQDLQAFVVTPISPHTLTNRPLVDRADCRYSMTVPNAPDGVMLVVDGQIKLPFSGDDRVTVRRASVTCQLVRLPSMSFYRNLHRKLGWGGQPHYGADAQ